MSKRKRLDSTTDAAVPALQADSELATDAFADIEPEQIDWLWEGKIARGKLTALVSRPGIGKSMLTCDLAARVSSGEVMPDGTPGVLGGAHVLLANAEDGAGDTIRPRLDAAGADVGRVHLLRGVVKPDGTEAFFTFEDAPVLQRALQRHRDEQRDIALIVIDPVGSYLNGKGDSHRDNDVRKDLGPLVKMAQDFNVAVVLVMHTRKAVGRIADDMVLGSRAFTGICRQVWHLSKNKDDPTRRLLLPGKSNIAAVATGMSFGFWGEGQKTCIAWDRDPIHMTADDAASAEVDAANRSGEADEDRRTARDEARHFLLQVLRDGRRPVKEVEAEAKAAGISVSAALRRAREDVCEKPIQEAGRWHWELTAPATVEAAETFPRAHEHPHEQVPPTGTGCSSDPQGAHLTPLQGKNDKGRRWGETPDDPDEHPSCAGHQTPSDVLDFGQEAA
ncbi:MAG: AAA family ATPase [Planctomycetota bacterium]